MFYIDFVFKCVGGKSKGLFNILTLQKRRKKALKSRALVISYSCQYDQSIPLPL